MVVRLLDAARAARLRAYAPYSQFSVGAAILTGSGEVFVGVNIENASYPATICAERAAVAAAVSAGARDLLAVAVVGPQGRPCPPCGICRQVLAEFNSEMAVVLEDGENGWHVLSLTELLPGAFTARHLTTSPGGEGGWTDQR
ncbi:MAG: cytidine deaminase [Limnochordales bacterium]|nr:cytidine deaminase [Limnochordales bacterium]